MCITSWRHTRPHTHKHTHICIYTHTHRWYTCVYTHTQMVHMRIHTHRITVFLASLSSCRTSAKSSKLRDNNTGTPTAALVVASAAVWSLWCYIRRISVFSLRGGGVIKSESGTRDAMGRRSEKKSKVLSLLISAIFYVSVVCTLAGMVPPPSPPLRQLRCTTEPPLLLRQ